MSNEKQKVEAVVERGVDAVVAGDFKGRVLTKGNARELVEASKDVLRSALNGAAKGAVKGAVIGAFEGALDEANKLTAAATGNEPIGDVEEKADPKSEPLDC